MISNKKKKKPFSVFGNKNNYKSTLGIKKTPKYLLPSNLNTFRLGEYSFEFRTYLHAHTDLFISFSS